MMENLTNKVYNKLNNEYIQYINNIKNLSAEKIIDSAYEIIIKKEFVDMFYSDNGYKKYALQILLEQDNTLDFLYEDWISSDGGIHKLLKENLIELLYDLDEEHRIELNKKIKFDTKFELIKDIGNTLKELDKYDFCIDIKKKYDAYWLDNIDIYEILNSKDGAEYLYDYFNTVKKEKQIEYLEEIMVINTTYIDNIDDKILPKLKEIIKEQHQNKKKERDER